MRITCKSENPSTGVAALTCTHVWEIFFALHADFRVYATIRMPAIPYPVRLCGHCLDHNHIDAGPYGRRESETRLTSEPKSGAEASGASGILVLDCAGCPESLMFPSRNRPRFFSLGAVRVCGDRRPESLMI